MNTDHAHIEGHAAALRIENLDTDQIIPKQFLRGIDKAGLDAGLLYDLRFDAAGIIRPDFVLNRPEHASTSILIGGANFGCGSSREHAVWALQQYGIRAVVAPSFGEIFYSNAMNNRLLLVMLPPADVEAFAAVVNEPSQAGVRIDVDAMTVTAGTFERAFTLSPRHRAMFLQGLDVIGMSLLHQPAIDDFSARHFMQSPWLKDIAQRARVRAT